LSICYDHSGTAIQIMGCSLEALRGQWGELSQRLGCITTAAR